MPKAKKSSKYQKKMVDGKENPKYVDLLDEDKPISGQKFCCVSFLSPEKIVKQKELFFFDEFLKQWDINKSMDKFIQFMNFIAYKHNLVFDEIMSDFKEFVNDEKEIIYKSSMYDDFKTYLDNNEEKMLEKFNKLHGFQPSTRGVKIRGSFPSMEEAELRCKILREMDPNHDVYVGPIGMWMPWDPDAYKTGRVEHMEDELNQLMHEKTVNETSAKNEFEKHVKETKQKAIEENKKNAEKYGTQVTQTIDEQGNLVNVNNLNTQETELSKNDEISVSDIQKELFEGDNVVMNLTDGGLSEIRNKMKESMQEKETVEEDIVIIETESDVKEEVQVETQVEVKEEPVIEAQAEVQEEVQVETQVEVKEEPLVESEDEVQEEPQNETNDEMVNKPSTSNNKKKKKKKNKKK
jgi:hypothetical protein